MKYLLDTHIYLWWSENSTKLDKRIRTIIENPENVIYISVINAWEMAIKFAAKKLILKKSIVDLFSLPEFEVLPVEISHILVLQKLPLLHKDPFDRLLIAQAKSEKMKLLTDDKIVLRYL